MKAKNPGSYGTERNSSLTASRRQGTFLDVGQHDINLGSQSESPTGTTYPDLTAVSSVTLRFLRFMRR